MITLHLLRFRKGPYILVFSFILVISFIFFILSLIQPSLNQAISDDRTGSALVTVQPAIATGPLRVNPANPRYFTDGTGKSIYLTGSHTWANFQDAGESDPPPVFDYQAYLNLLQNNHLNFFRLWMWEQAKWIPSLAGGIWFTPPVYQRNGPGMALDGKLSFDLTKFNQPYFDLLRSRVMQARDRGIYVSIMLFNGFSIDDKTTGPGNAWPGHPFNSSNNINEVNGDKNGDGKGEETHTLQLDAITAYQETYVRKVIDTVNDLDNVMYEISNESPSNSQDWQYHMINYVKSYEAGLLKQHPVGMTVEYPGGDNAELFASPADWISPNDVGGYKDNPPAALGNKVIIVDTDHLWGIGGDRQWVWKSFTRGLNPIYMDCYSRIYCTSDFPGEATRMSVIANLGYTISFANRINLTTMVPHGELASSGFALANPSGPYAAYLVYVPSGSTVTVTLTGTQNQLTVLWFNPATGTSTSAGVVSGGKNQVFVVPFNGDAVLYLYTKLPNDNIVPLISRN